MQNSSQVPSLRNRVIRWLFWQRLPVEEIRLRNPRREALIFSAYALFFILLSLTTGLLIRRWPHPLLGATYFTQDAWYIFFFKLLGLLTVPLVIFYRLGYTWRDLVLDWRPTPRSILMILVALAVGLSFNTKYYGQIRHVAAVMPHGEFALRLIAGILTPLLQAGLPEEIMYRGILHTRLEAIWGRLAGWLATAVVFTAWHLPTRFLLAHGAEGSAGNFASVLLGTGLPVFVVALILGWLWDRYRSLVPLVALHWAIDTLPSIAAFMRLPF